MKKPTAEQKRFHRWVSERGCQICHYYLAAFHHEPLRRQEGASHWSGVALCPKCHGDARVGRHGLGSLELFDEMHQCDLLELAAENRENYERDVGIGNAAER